MSFFNKSADDIIILASEFKQQQYHSKGLKADWFQIEKDLNANGYNVVCNESFRCKVKAFEKKNGILKEREEYRSEVLDNKISDIELKTIELKKEKYKLKDEKGRFNKLIKEVAKKEDFHDFIADAIKELAQSKPLEVSKLEKKRSNKTGVLQLSDWHFANVTDNFLNEYNIEVFYRRIADVIKNVITYSRDNNIEELIILLQGDFFSSSIHKVLQVQNQEDLISQITQTSEILAETISMLSEELKIKIKISCVLDNHSRVTADKKESIDKENYMRITEWYLKARLKPNKNITFMENSLGAEISSFEIYELKCASVHGHKDKFATIVPKLTSFTRDIYDIMFTSHLHHLHVEEINMVTVISNGSLCGVDDFSSSLRMSSHPMQMFSIFVKDYGLQQMYPIRVE